MKSIFFLLAFMTAASSQAAAADLAPPSCGLQQAASLDMTMEPSGTVEVPVAINNRPLRLTVDTGDIYSLLSTEVPEELGVTPQPLPMIFTLLGGVHSNMGARMDSLAIGSMKAEEFMFALMPQWALGQTSDGLLGPDIMSNYDVEMDFARAKLNFFLQEHCPGKVVYWTKGTYAQIPITLEHDWHITATADIDGKPITVLLDTGAPTSVMSVDTVKSVFGIDTSNPTLRNLGQASINGTVRQNLYSIPFQKLTLSGISVSNPEIVVVPNTGMGSGLPQLVLGMSVLRQLHLYIAYKEHMLYVTSATAH